MSDEQHTPKPWVATFYDERVSKHPHWAVDCNPPDVLSVATIHSGYGNLGEEEANARLIAAAPDLLEACREAYDYVHAPIAGRCACNADESCPWYPEHQLADVLKAAIAKATKQESINDE